MNLNSVADDLMELIETGLDSTSVIVPYQKGNSIRIGSYAIRKNSKGYQVYDCAKNARIGVTNFKVSAVALAKSLAEGRNYVDRIMYVDSELLKHYNDAVYYRNRIRRSDDLSVVESRLHRLDISIAKSKALKQDLDKFIF